MESHVSVVITTYNSCNVIERSLSSIKNQENISCEVLVVDDCSSDVDELYQIIEMYSQEISINFLPQNKKGNANISRNIGINNAKYDYVAFLDADDTWEPNHLSSATDSMLNNNAEMCFSKVQFVKNGVAQSSSQPTFKGDVAEYIFSNGIAVTSSIVAKRDALLACMFDEQQFKHQDWEFLIRFEKQFKVCQSEYVGLNYTLSSGDNMSSKFNPAATVRFLNKALPEKYHKVMLLSQLYPMIKQCNKKAIISLTKELDEAYKYTPSNLGFRVKLYTALFSKDFNPFRTIIFKSVDISIRSIKKLFN